MKASDKASATPQPLQRQAWTRVAGCELKWYTVGALQGLPILWSHIRNIRANVNIDLDKGIDS